MFRCHFHTANWPNSMAAIASDLLNTVLQNTFNHDLNFPENPYSSDRLSHMLVFFSALWRFNTALEHWFKCRGTDYYHKSLKAESLHSLKTLTASSLNPSLTCFTPLQQQHVSAGKGSSFSPLPRADGSVLPSCSQWEEIPRVSASTTISYMTVCVFK